MNQIENKRLVWPDLLRIISIFSVIVIHVSSIGLKDYDAGSQVWVWSCLLNCASRWAVPVFFMISGSFFLDPERPFDFRGFLKKHVFRIILCIVVWGFLYSFLDQYLYGTLSWKSFLIAIYGILTGNTGYHLWFLYTLLVLYISTPVLRIIAMYADRRQLDFALWIWFFLVVAVPNANLLAEELFGLSSFLPFEPVAVAGYGGFNLLGYRLKNYPLSKKWFAVLLVFGSLSIVVMPALDLFFSIKKGELCQVFSAPLGVCTCLVSASLFSLFSRLDLKAAWISWVAKRVFGIYLVHVFFVSLLFRVFNARLDSFIAPFPIAGFSLLIFAVSFAVSWLFALIPLLKKVV